jgi:hypothetical protein
VIEQNSPPNETARIEAFSDGVFAIAIHACRAKIVHEHLNVIAITKQYALEPIMYAVLMIVAFFSAEWCLALSILFAVYFALPPSLWSRRIHRRSSH